MAKVTPITEHFQHFVSELKESFWGDLQGQTRKAAQRLFELLSERQARLKDDWAYLFLDGVSLRVRRTVGRKRVQMLVAYGVKRDGSHQLLAFLRTRGESQADWEALLNDLYRRGVGRTEPAHDRHRRMSKA